MALGVEGERGLARLDRQCPLGVSAGLQRGGDRPGGAQRLAPGLRERLVPREDAVDLVVVEALVRADAGAVEGRLGDVRAVEVEFDGDREALHPGLERARLVRERLGEHRLHPARDVDARPAQVGLAIEGRAGRDVGGDVRDVHPDPVPLAPEVFRGDRVVEVLRGDGVDREGGELAQVAARVARRVACVLPGQAVPRLRGRALDPRREAALEASVEHVTLEDVGRDVGSPDDPHDPRPLAAPLPRQPDEHEVAGPRVPGALEHDRPAALEERLGRRGASASGKHADDRLAHRGLPGVPGLALRPG